MKILGFNFTKISAEKKSGKLEGVQLKPILDIKEVNNVNSEFLNTKGSILGIKFSYTIDYSPNFAEIQFLGNLIVEIDSKLSEEVLEKWKNKELPEKFRFDILNVILNKSQVRALQLEEELNIPLHIPLPKLKKEESK